jgi:hypothetical protein
MEKKSLIGKFIFLVLNGTVHSILLLVHCKENAIYVFLFWELRGLSPNFHIHVFLSDLCIPRIGPPIFPAAEQQTDPGNKYS